MNQSIAVLATRHLVVFRWESCQFSPASGLALMMDYSDLRVKHLVRPVSSAAGLAPIDGLLELASKASCESSFVGSGVGTH